MGQERRKEGMKDGRTEDMKESRKAGRKMTDNREENDIKEEEGRKRWTKENQGRSGQERKEGKNTKGG
jgi:hypothetical protein